MILKKGFIMVVIAAIIVATAVCAGFILLNTPKPDTVQNEQTKSTQTHLPTPSVAEAATVDQPLTTTRVPVLMYHHIVPEELGLHKNNGAVLPVGEFRRQMKYLHDEGFYTPTLSELEAFVKGQADLPEKSVILTFDDGYESNYIYAFPILKQYNLKAVINLIGALIPEKNGEFDPQVLTYLSHAQLKQMTDSGLVEIGSHTYDLHKKDARNRSMVSVYDKQKITDDFQMLNSKLQELLGDSPVVIAYPYGVFNDKTIEASKEAGYTLGFTIQRGYVKPGDDLLKLNRFAVPPSMEFSEFVEVVAGSSEGLKSRPAKEYDVIVVGSDPEGIAAAVSASRFGLKTLLTDSRQRVGGLMTLGGLATIDMNRLPSGEIINKGIFLEFYRKLGNTTSFDVSVVEKVFENMLREAGVNLLLGCDAITPVVKDGVIQGLRTVSGNAVEIYKAKRVIDATQDADIAASAGVPYTEGLEDIGLKDARMVATLVFRLKNVDWGSVRAHLNRDPDKMTGADKTSAWGYSSLYSYKTENPNLRMRGLNMARQQDGTVLVNALQIFGINPFSQKSRQQAIDWAEKELPRIVEYINETCPGLESAELDGVVEELYIRESRHIIGEYRLTIDDVLENRYFEDTIAFGSYPVDVQPTTPQDYGMVVGNPAVYGVPFRSIVPLKVDNLLVVGRSASFDSLAAGSARTIPVGMSTGEAAGTAAYYSIKNNVDFREMAKPNSAHVKDVISMLNKNGAGLKPFSYPVSLMKHWAYPYIKHLRRLGLIYGGYNNDYKQDAQVTAQDLDNLFNSVFLRIDPSRGYRSLNISEPVGRKALLSVLKEHTGKDWSILDYKEAEWISLETAQRLEADDTVTYGEIYALLSDLLKTLGGDGNGQS
jgi:peptidoglycan/xylan/chitin deacetylase (PgdA/CDA1 family)